jgi:hypothetical protein
VLFQQCLVQPSRPPPPPVLCISHSSSLTRRAPPPVGNAILPLPFLHFLPPFSQASFILPASLSLSTPIIPANSASLLLLSVSCSFFSYHFYLPFHLQLFYLVAAISTVSYTTPLSLLPQINYAQWKPYIYVSLSLSAPGLPLPQVISIRCKLRISLHPCSYCPSDSCGAFALDDGTDSFLLYVRLQGRLHWSFNIYDCYISRCCGLPNFWIIFDMLGVHPNNFFLLHVLKA